MCNSEVFNVENVLFTGFSLTRGTVACTTVTKEMSLIKGKWHRLYNRACALVEDKVNTGHP